jgi:fumarate hydratase subunit alpha
MEVPTQREMEGACLELLRRASTLLPPDVRAALRRALRSERDPVARTNLRAVLENVEVAEREGLPLCQDTGFPLFYFRMRPSPELDPGRAAARAIRRATKEGILRPNTVHPLSRKNPGDNLGRGLPLVRFLPPRGKGVEVTVMLKGAGAENVSRTAMLTPEEGVEGLREFAVRTVVEAGGKPCPPVIVGVGVGGTAEVSMELAELALLRPLPPKHPEAPFRRLEEELEGEINRRGSGPMGLGGRTTCLGVKVEYAHTHTASLPVSVNLQCWAARRASVRIEGGEWEWW